MLHSLCEQIRKTQQWPQDWKRSVFIPTPKKGNAKDCSNYRTTALFSQTSKCTKFSKPGFNGMWTENFQMFKLDLEKAQQREIKLPTSTGSPKKQESSRKMYFCFTDYTKAFDYVDHDELWKTLKEMGIPDHLTCLLRNLYAGQEATVKTRHGTTDWFQVGKGVCQGCVLLPYLFNLHVMSTSWEMPSWIKHKLELRLPGETSIMSDMQMTPPSWQKVKRNWEASWWKWKTRVKKLA